MAPTVDRYSSGDTESQTSGTKSGINWLYLTAKFSSYKDSNQIDKLLIKMSKTSIKRHSKSRKQ
jgi:hypothetical protein